MEKDKQLIEKDDISYVSVFNPKPTTPKEIQLAEHKMWLRTIRKEYPRSHFKIFDYLFLMK